MIPTEYQPQNFWKNFEEQKTVKRRDTIKEENLKEIQKEQEKSLRLLADTQKNMTLAQLKKMELIEKFGGVNKKIKMVGRSCFLFSPKNWLRKICYRIVKLSFYDTIVLILIAISTILLTLDNPNIDANGGLANVLQICDYILTTLFTLECLINIILFGFVCNGKHSYARDPWNVMDLLIVFFSIFTLIL